MKGNCIIGQSGGPTAVINCSLAGVAKAIRQTEKFGTLYGMRYGIEGFMNEWLINLSDQPKNLIKGLRQTPGSALGSSRHKLKDEDFPRIVEVLKKYDIRYFFLIGGNDSMDTINRVVVHCRNHGYDLIGLGIPKTVDNDLFGTDHTPGFPSAARSNILNVMQAGVLARDMKKVDQFVVYQTIGRDAGWLGAATAAGKIHEDDAPHLIYCPEFAFNRENFLTDVEGAYKKYGFVSVVCGEGLKYADGTAVSASQTKDKFNNTEFGAMGGASVGLNLHRMISQEFGFRGEFQITESLIMSDFVRSVELDQLEAYAAGQESVRLALEGESGNMVTIERLSNEPYESTFGKIALQEVAVKAKPMPREYFNEAGNFVSPAFLDYIRPLIGDLPEFVKFK
jgi:ATP-dependent phosphofructokinase / diphosphate-dependent phosphofructokinase